MGLFKGKPKGGPEDEIVEIILQQPDRLSALLNILDKLPQDLSQWFRGLVKLQGTTKNYVEVDIAESISSGLFLPGDLVIKKNRDPKVGDIVEIGYRAEEEYTVQDVKIKKINLKEGTLYVENPLNPNSAGNIGISNIICVIDKVIKLSDPNWKRITNILNIDYDFEEISKWVRQNLDYIKKTENFHERESNIKKLEERLRLLKKK